jgi:hypothetical protein
MSDNKEQEIIPWIKAPGGIVEVYANNLHIMWSKDDVRIRLAQMIPSPETLDPGVDFQGANEERAAVTLTWRLAKVLRDSLSRAIDGYEKVNGEINIDIQLPPSSP